MATRGNLRMTKAPATAQKLFTLGTQYEVRESDGTWVKGTVTKVLAKRITVAFDKIYPVTVFDKEEIQRDVEQLLESNEFRWVDTKLSKKVLKKSEKEVVETLSSLTGATTQNIFQDTDYGKARLLPTSTKNSLLSASMKMGIRNITL